MSETLLVAMTTVPDAATGRQIARALVERRLVACAQLLPPMESIYVWQGELCSESEQLLLFKLPAAGYAAFAAALGALHPYEVPEIVALEAVQVAASYLGWACAQTGPR